MLAKSPLTDSGSVFDEVSFQSFCLTLPAYFCLIFLEKDLGFLKQLVVENLADDSYPF